MFSSKLGLQLPQFLLFILAKKRDHIGAKTGFGFETSASLHSFARVHLINYIRLGIKLIKLKVYHTITR